MKVELRNFCGAEHRDIKFKKGLTLLNAESGRGKTTIFNGIFWCLYGRLQNVYPLDSSKQTPGFTSVTVKLKGCTIQRSKPPERLTLTLGEKEEYEGDEAQEMIDRIFGSRNVWISTSYVRQEERNPLLSSSNAEKLEVIKEIIFGKFTKDREPDEYLKTLDDKITKASKQIDEFNLQIATYSDILKDKVYVDILDPSPLSVDELKMKGKEMRSRLKKAAEINERVKRSDKAKEKILKVKEKLQDYPLEDVDLNKFVKMMTLKNNRPPPQSEVPKVTEFEISDLKVKIKNKHKGQRICKKYGIEYTQESIEKEIASEMKLKELTESHRNYIRQKKQRDQDILALKVLSCKMKEGNSDTLTCPSCSTDLVLKKGELEIYNDKDLVEKYQRLKTRVSVDIEEVEAPESYDPSKVKELHGIIVYSLSDDILDDKMKGLELYKRYTEYIKWKEENEKNYISKFKDMVVNDPHEYVTSYKVLRSQLSALEKDITDEEYKDLDLEEEMKDTEDMLINKLKYLENQTIKSEIDQLNGKLKKLGKNVKKITRDKEELTKIREVVSEGINKVMEDQMDSFNSLLNKVLDDLYDNISVKVKMFKKIKSRNVYKPQFDLSINLNGKKYNTYHILSPGEKDRVSMALTIAMNKIMGSKIIILDECMSSMDGELRVKAIESIRKHLSDKIVINVCHGMITGYYDYIKDL